jgi:hypothetical protein
VLKKTSIVTLPTVCCPALIYFLRMYERVCVYNGISVSV